MDSRTRIRTFVAQLLDDQGHRGEITDQESLVNSGLLDSLAMVQIVIFMEKEFDIDFSDIYFEQEDFDTIESMLAFVEKYRHRSPGEPEETS